MATMAGRAQPVAGTPDQSPDVPVPSAGLRVLGWGLLVMALGLAINSILGPLAADLIDYPVSDSMRNQTIGLDAASLIVVAPVSAAVGILALRRHPAAPVLALGPAGFVAYMFVQYVAGPDHLSYPPVLVLQLGLFAAGWLLAGLAWHLDPGRPGEGTVIKTLGPAHGWVAVVLGLFVLARYVPGLIGSITNEPLPAEVATDPAMYWLIVLLDLGVYLPATTLAAVGLWRARPWGSRLHRGLVGWFVLTTIAVAAMSATMSLNDDPNASAGQLMLFVVVAIGIVSYAAAIIRPEQDHLATSTEQGPGRT